MAFGIGKDAELKVRERRSSKEVWKTKPRDKSD